MAPSIIIPASLKHATFLLDTNFLIDAYSKPQQFGEFIANLKGLDIALVSINFVKYEFIRSKTINVVKQKLIYFEEKVETVLPVDITTEKLVPGLIEEYKQFIEGVSVVDLLLGACIKRYKSLKLLTRNHSDFPTKIYNREHIFTIELENDVKSYGIYSYKPEADVLEEFPF